MNIEVPKLANWLTIPEVAAILGVSKQYVLHTMAENGDFKSLRSLGSKPIYVVSAEEVKNIALTRQLRASVRAENKAKVAV